MNSISTACFLLVALIIQGCTSVAVEEFECKGVKYQISEKHIADVKQCLAKVGVATFEEMNVQNAGCFSRCTMMQQGLIDDAGKPHKEKIMNMIDEHVPEAIRADWKSASEMCLDTEGSKIDIADDKTCESFLPLTMCFHQSFVKICS